MTRRAALALADRGLHVFPIVPGEKKVPACERGVYAGTCDPVQIRRMWRPGFNVGIWTGASRLVVIDLDRKDNRDGFADLEALELEHGQLPPTLTARTPTGGMHLYFRAPEHVEIRPSVAQVAHGIDVRASGSYVVAPPSQINGHRYEWTQRMRPVGLPDAWVRVLAPPPREVTPEPIPVPTSERERDRLRRYCLTAMQAEARELAATPKGARNDRLWRAAAALGGLVHTGGIDAEEITAALGWACSQWRERNPRKDADTLWRGLAFGMEHPRGGVEEARHVAA